MTTAPDSREPAKDSARPDKDKAAKHEPMPPRGGDAGFGEEPVFRRGW